MDDNGIILARVFYQRGIESTTPLKREQMNDLQILSFPKEKIKGDRFRKIFPFGNQIALATENQSPKWKVPTADLALIGLNVFNKMGRDVFAIFNFMDQIADKDFLQISANDFTSSPKINNSIISSESSFRNFLEKVQDSLGIQLITEIFGAFIFSGKLSITPKDHKYIQDALTAVYLLLPISKISSTTLVIYEDVLNHIYKFDSLQTDDEFRNKRTTGIFGKESTPSVNLDENKIIGKYKSEFIELLVAELFNEPWYDFTKLEQYRTLIEILELLSKDSNFTDIYDRFDKLRRLQSTVTRLDKLNDLLKISGRKLF